jgi:hypothetical protein
MDLKTASSDFILFIILPVYSNKALYADNTLKLEYLNNSYSSAFPKPTAPQ